MRTGSGEEGVEGRAELELNAIDMVGECYDFLSFPCFLPCHCSTMSLLLLCSST